MPPHLPSRIETSGLPPEMWDKFVRLHPNISFVFSGHILGDGKGRLVGIGDNRNKVYQMLANYQMLTNSGNGYLRLVEFDLSQQKVRGKTYSPNLGFGSEFYVWFTLSQFSFDGVELVFGNLHPQFLGDLYMFPGQIVLLQLIKPESKSVMRITNFRGNLNRS